VDPDEFALKNVNKVTCHT